jgi:hypothetical protein
MTVADVIGWMGAVAVVATYAHAARGGMRAGHHVGNALGGAGLAIGAIAHGTWSSVAENGVWLGLALYGLASCRRSDRRSVLAWPRSLVTRRPARAHRQRPSARPVEVGVSSVVAPFRTARVAGAGASRPPGTARASRATRSARSARVARAARGRTSARAWIDAHPLSSARATGAPAEQTG